MKVRFSTKAARELREIGIWIARRNPETAVRFLQELRQTANKIGDAPRGYPIVERYKGRGIRRRVHGNYLLFYRIEETRVVILHILHAARDNETLLDREFAGD